jgi:hypothetical protein
MKMNFADKVDQLIEEAPVAGFANVNYGKLAFEVSILSFVDKADGSGAREAYRVPYVDRPLKDGENIELTFEIGIMEINPKLTFNFKRNVIMKKTSADGKTKADWDQVVLPSLIATFGKDWAKVISDPKKPVYVAAEAPDSVQPIKEGKKNYGTIKFIQKFKNLEECKAARDERYGSKGEAVEEDGVGIPAAIIDQAKGVWASLKGNEATFRKMMASDPFSAYDVDAILAEINPIP